MVVGNNNGDISGGREAGCGERFSIGDSFARYFGYGADNNRTAGGFFNHIAVIQIKEILDTYEIKVQGYAQDIFAR